MFLQGGQTFWVRDLAAYGASLWAFVFAAMSFYWAAGGTVGVETIGPAVGVIPIPAGLGHTGAVWHAILWGP